MIKKSYQATETWRNLKCILLRKRSQSEWVPEAGYEEWAKWVKIKRYRLPVRSPGDVVLAW